MLTPTRPLGSLTPERAPSPRAAWKPTRPALWLAWATDPGEFGGAILALLPDIHINVQLLPSRWFSPQSYCIPVMNSSRGTCWSHSQTRSDAFSSSQVTSKGHHQTTLGMPSLGSTFCSSPTTSFSSRWSDNSSRYISETLWRGTLA